MTDFGHEERVQESGVVGHRYDTDDRLEDLDIYEALVNPHDGQGGSRKRGGGGAPAMMPMGNTGSSSKAETAAAGTTAAGPAKGTSAASAGAGNASGLSGTGGAGVSGIGGAGVSGIGGSRWTEFRRGGRRARIRSRVVLDDAVVRNRGGGPARSDDRPAGCGHRHDPRGLHRPRGRQPADDDGPRPDAAGHQL
jgi:hypothetical protein